MLVTHRSAHRRLLLHLKHHKILLLNKLLLLLKHLGIWHWCWHRRRLIESSGELFAALLSSDSVVIALAFVPAPGYGTEEYYGCACVASD